MKPSTAIIMIASLAISLLIFLLWKYVRRKAQPYGWVESATVTVPGPPETGFMGQPFPDSTRYYPNLMNGMPMHPIYIFLEGQWQYDWEETEKKYPRIFNHEAYPGHPGGTTIKIQ